MRVGGEGVRDERIRVCVGGVAQTWYTPMTMESIEKRTKQSEVVCGKGVDVLRVNIKFFLASVSTSIFPPNFRGFLG